MRRGVLESSGMMSISWRAPARSTERTARSMLKAILNWTGVIARAIPALEKIPREHNDDKR